MSTKSEWQTANEQLMAEERHRLGQPPAADEILAYSRGELSPDEEERMRERLVCHPEILRAMAVPFPAEGAEPGHPDYLRDEEWPAHWEALRKRMGRGRVVDFRRHAWTALAAAAALVFAGLYGHAEWKARRPQLVGNAVELFSDSRRGPAGPPTTVVVEGDSVILAPVVIEQPELDGYRVAIFDANGSRELWRSGRVLPRDGRRLSIVVPRSFLSPGDYRVVVYGIDGSGEEESLAAYTIHVPGR